MASGDDGLLALPAASNMGRKSTSIQHRRLNLEKEVTELHRMLHDEEKVHEILERALLPQNALLTLRISSFLPKKTKELLAELVVVEEEIARLESEISKVQVGLPNMQGAEEQKTSKVFNFKDTNVNVIVEPSSDKSVASSHVPGQEILQQKIALETKPLFFINQAIKGDYLVNGFSNIRSAGSLTRSFHYKGSQRAVEIKERASRKGRMPQKASLPKLPIKHLSNKDANVENFLTVFKEHSTVNSTDKNGGEYQPNKLSEKILKCLICIFLRFIRTSRALDLEKSGNLLRSANVLLRSGNFQIDGNLMLKGKIPTQREIRHHDPYEIFEIEDSLLRDIGPYKNLVKFTSCSLDHKDISSSLALLKKLRILISSLHKVDLTFLTHQEKLAFWINVYNICIMHSFLELGMPSNPEMAEGLKNKAALNIGGHKLNALAIKHLILKQSSNSNEDDWKVRKDDKEMVPKDYGLEQSNPNIVFALCSGCKSSPAVRIYTADGIVGELEKSKMDYLQASIAVTSSKRILIPHLLHSNMHDFARDLDSLVDWIVNQLPTSWPLRKSMLECLKGRTAAKISHTVDVIPNNSEFQYLLPM
ncbi:hypothetical protein C4D60_Mb11t01780 [Musa balbisiana]|uniref:DUF547 domain-containing protein n=1 Tax=Musa balbisiana TaxID=52838 RepID=A0A4S8J3H6_MUSBA|nr:hypothetical protein C4D60_Mb11t01780 [Musa balbisiana]